MKFIDLFAGIGGFRRGFEMAGHECIGFCEYDKFAVASYVSMHTATDAQREYISTLPKSERVKELQKDQYRNGEWFKYDIRTVNVGNIPRADCWTFGAPCQDFSIAGKRAGLAGDRSGLVREVFRIIEETPEDNRPEWLVYENVKGMLSSNGGRDFMGILLSLDELGYDAEWSLFNSKYFGVPQSRERVYLVGHNRKGSGGGVLFDPSTGGQNQMDESQIIQIGGIERDTFNNPQVYRVYSADGIAPTLQTSQGGGHCPYIIAGGRIRRLTPRECFRLQGWADEYYDRAEMVNSDTQLYKQAGNGVTVTVAQAVGEAIQEAMERETE